MNTTETYIIALDAKQAENVSPVQVSGYGDNITFTFHNIQRCNEFPEFYQFDTPFNEDVVKSAVKARFGPVFWGKLLAHNMKQ